VVGGAQNGRNLQIWGLRPGRRVEGPDPGGPDLRQRGAPRERGPESVQTTPDLGPRPPGGQNHGLGVLKKPVLVKYDGVKGPPPRREGPRLGGQERGRFRPDLALF